MASTECNGCVLRVFAHELQVAVTGLEGFNHVWQGLIWECTDAGSQRIGQWAVLIKELFEVKDLEGRGQNRM